MTVNEDCILIVLKFYEGFYVIIGWNQIHCLIMGRSTVVNQERTAKDSELHTWRLEIPANQ